MKRGAVTLVTLDVLIEAAVEAREHAYAPYSRYKVGAAIATSSDRLYRGCNVESSSYGATICAERSAIAQMVAAGDRDPVACAVATGGSSPGTPCGICRQALFEFADDMPIALVAVGARRRTRSDTTLSALLPMGFRLARSKR
jgi:cytidine deaminase